MLTEWEAEAPTEPPKGSAVGLGGSAEVQGKEHSELSSPQTVLQLSQLLLKLVRGG